MVSKSFVRGLKSFVLDTAYWTGLHRIVTPIYGGLGTIFAMHRVVTSKEESPARHLTISAKFLDDTIQRLRATGVEFVSLDEVKRRLANRQRGRPFVALTFDDGYRDNLDLALPILRRYAVPATIYVPSGAPDRTLDAWWLRLEEGLRQKTRLSIEIDGRMQCISVNNVDEKAIAYSRLTALIHQDIARNREIVEGILPKSELSDEALLSSYFLGWDQLRKLTADPLVTLGTHTVKHSVLSDLDDGRALAEMVEGRKRLSDELGVSADHFAYPFGSDAECGSREFELAARAGFSTAVTTRRGNVFPRHVASPMALPRYPLGGRQETASDPVLSMSGAPVVLGSRWKDPVVTF